jgi:MerR family transcriptional regulator, light-induced transcriptional regulator
MSHAQLLLTPKELADAIGASESSLRRWVDGGQIRISRTAGGHRRIPLAEAIQFIRAIGATVVRPDVLGLADMPPAGGHLLRLPDGQRLFDALRTGERRLARGLILSWYLQGRSLPALFDGPVSESMHQIGELWNHDARGILIEHRATEICIGIMAEIRELLPAVVEDAPLALGGGPQNDPYVLPTMMADAVLAEVGFRSVNFGANTPVGLLMDEAIERRARLVWLSISAAQESKSLRAAIKQLADGLARHNINLVLGGRCHAACIPRDSDNVSLIGSMSELAAFARGLLSGHTSGAT